MIARRAERDGGERDQQRDDDARRLVDQHPDARRA